MVFRDVDKKALIDNAAKILSKITIIEDNIVFTEDDSIVDWTYEDFRYVPENGFIGHFVERLLDGNLQDVPKEVILENKEINVQIGIVNGTTNETTFYDYGNFIVTTAERDDVSGSISFESADYTKKFNIEYVNNVTYPCLPADILVDACTQVGIDFDSYGDTYYYIPGDNETLPAGKYAIKINNNFYEFTTRAVTKDLSCITVVVEDGLAPVVTHKIVDTENLTVTREVLSYTKVSSSTASVLNVKNTKYLKLVNNDFVIRNNQFDSSDTCRDAVKAVAKLGFTWARIGTDNKLHLDFTQNDKSSVSEYNVITTDDYYNEQNQQEIYGPVNCVSLGYSQVEGDDISRVVSSYTEGDKLYEIKVDDNPLWYTDELKVIALHDCDRLFGIEYAVFSTETVGHPWLEGDDLVRLDNLTGDTLYTYPFDRNITYSGFIKGVISSTANSYVQDQLNYDGDVAKNIRKTLFLVDKANQRVEILAQTVEGYDEKIAKIELNNQSISLSVTNVEKSLNTTNSTVNALQKDVDSVEGSLAGIQDEIDGVSADFEDFKDNEYLQSIDNLQKQIDGAIQFWNGASIPTLNNYPANEWKTENDRINHQADIYTVIEDVDGELKQGKGYRFDKVNGTWKWIELTDNELSAVQALADEALKKANANAGEITALKKTTTDLSVRDGEITASVNELNTKFETEVVVAKDASGNPIIVEDAGPYDLLSSGVDGKSYQATTQGYNLYDGTPSISGYNTGITVTRGDNNNYINIKVTSVSGTNRGFYINIKPYVTNRGFVNGDNVLIKYKIKTTNKSNFSPYFGDWEAGSNKKYSQSTESTLTGDYHERYLLCTFNANAQYGGFIFYSPDIAVDDVFEIKDFMICKSSTDKPYERYTGGFASPNPDFPSEIKNVEGARNLLPNIATTTTKNGVTFTINEDKSITLNGTATAGININLNYQEGYYSSLISGKTYTLNLTNNNGLYVRLAKVSDNTNLMTFDTPTTKKTFVSSYTGDTFVYLAILNGTTFDNLTIYPMFNEGDVALDYVPYGRWLEVESTGKNMLDLSSFKETTINGVTLTPKGNNTFTLKGTSTGHSNHNIAYKIPQEWLGKTLTLSVNENFKGNVGFKGKNVSGDIFIVNTENSKSKTLTITQEIIDKIYVFDIYASSSFTGEVTFSIQLEEGSTATTYEPYKENTALIDLNKKNLFEDGVVRQSNNTTSSSYQRVNYVSNKIYPKGTIFTIKNNSSFVFGAGILEQQTQGGDIIDDSGWVNKKTYTFTSTSDGYLTMNIKKSSEGNITPSEVSLSDFEIYEGVETDDYHRLASIGDTKDTFKDGILTQRIGKVVLDGSDDEGWAFQNKPNSTSSVIRTWIDDKYNTKSTYYSSHFIYDSQTDNRLVFLGNDLYLRIENSITGVVDTDSNNDILQKIKTWLSNNPVTVEYILKKPIEHNLNYEELELHEGYNNITTNDELEPNMSVTYLTNSKLNAQYVTKSELKVTTDSISTEVSSVTDLTKELGNDIIDINSSLSNYASADRVDTLEQSVKTLQTNSSYSISVVNELKEKGVSKVKTETGFEFNETGLHITNSDSPVGSTLDNKKLLIQDQSTSTSSELLYAGIDETTNEAIVRSKNLTVHKYLTIGTASRFEPYTDPDYEEAVGVFEV